MKEEWKDIVDYEGLYQVSNLGRVKSLNYKQTHKQLLLKPTIKKKTGYCQISLSKNGKKKLYLVHRLVAKAYLINQDNLPQVNHKDEDKTNNKVDNLEWCTAKYNCNYGTKIQRVKEKMAKPVSNYKNGKLIKNYSKVTEVVIDGHIPSDVTRCCKGKIKSHHGYQWKYK